MRIDDVLERRSVIELLVGRRRILQLDDLRVHHRSQIGHPIVQDGPHEGVVVIGRRRLACRHPRRLDPATGPIDFHAALLVVPILGDRIGAVNADRAGHPTEADIFQQRVGDGVLDDLVGLRPEPATVEAHIVDDAIGLALAGDPLQMIFDRNAVRQVDGLDAVRLEQIEPLLNEVGDDDGAGTEELRTGGARAADRPRAEDQHILADDIGRLRRPVGSGEPVERGRQHVRKERQITDLRHGRVLVGESQQIEVCIGHEQVIPLPPGPSTQVKAIGAAVDFGVGVLAHVRAHVLAVVAASAADVKGNGHDIADLDIFDVGADLDHLAGHFVAHRHPLGDFKRTSVDVKVAAADVRGDDLENGAVGSFFALWSNQLREFEGVDLHFHRFLEGYDPVACSHQISPAFFHAPPSIDESRT